MSLSAGNMKTPTHSPKTQLLSYKMCPDFRMQNISLKRLLNSLLCLVLVATTTVFDASAQRRKHPRLRGMKRTAATIGGGAATGAVIGGPVGATIGGAAATVYEVKRRTGQRRPKRHKRKARIGLP